MLTTEQKEAALIVYKRNKGTCKEAVSAAITAHLKSIPTSDSLRDYRKEVWIGIYLQNESVSDANYAVGAFDDAFQE